MNESEIVVSDLRLGSLQVDNSSAVIVQATAIATQLAKLINDRKLFNNIQGKKYVRVEGWNTLGAMLGVLPRELSTHQLEDGGYESTVELIRASDGVVIGMGSAIVGMDEPTWSKRPQYARRSMAITRATGKAFRLGFSWIMALAGYEATPAEEIADIVEGHVVEPSHTVEGTNSSQPALIGNPDPPKDDTWNGWIKTANQCLKLRINVPSVNRDKITNNELVELMAQYQAKIDGIKTDKYSQSA